LNRLPATGTSELIFHIAITVIITLSVIFMARKWKIHLEREVAFALLRGLSQIIIAGFLLLVIFRGPVWIGPIILMGMIIIAALITSRHIKDIPGSFRVAFYGILTGAGSITSIMVLTGVIDYHLPVLIPIGSMLVANAMNTSSLSLERLLAEIRSHRGHIEAALALGAEPRSTILPYITFAIKASLIPRIDSIKSLGIVWIPGLMAGMILGGSNPLYAAIYQFIIITLILSVAALSSLTCSLLIRSHLFTEAEQLILSEGY